MPNKRVVSREDICRTFNMPLVQAAEQLNISATLLKRLCRQYDIKRWPYRKIRSMERKEEKLSEDAKRSESAYGKLNKRLMELESKRNEYLSSLATEEDHPGGGGGGGGGPSRHPGMPTLDHTFSVGSGLGLGHGGGPSGVMEGYGGQYPSYGSPYDVPGASMHHVPLQGGSQAGRMRYWTGADGRQQPMYNAQSYMENSPRHGGPGASAFHAPPGPVQGGMSAAAQSMHSPYFSSADPAAHSSPASAFSPHAQGAAQGYDPQRPPFVKQESLGALLRMGRGAGAGTLARTDSGLALPAPLSRGHEHERSGHLVMPSNMMPMSPMDPYMMSGNMPYGSYSGHAGSSSPSPARPPLARRGSSQSNVLQLHRQMSHRTLHRNVMQAAAATPSPRQESTTFPTSADRSRPQQRPETAAADYTGLPVVEGTSGDSDAGSGSVANRPAPLQIAKSPLLPTQILPTPLDVNLPSLEVEVDSSGVAINPKASQFAQAELIGESRSAGHSQPAGSSSSFVRGAESIGAGKGADNDNSHGVSGVKRVDTSVASNPRLEITIDDDTPSASAFSTSSFAAATPHPPHLLDTGRVNTAGSLTLTMTELGGHTPLSSSSSTAGSLLQAKGVSEPYVTGTPPASSSLASVIVADKAKSAEDQRSAN